MTDKLDGQAKLSQKRSHPEAEQYIYVVEKGVYARECYDVIRRNRNGQGWHVSTYMRNRDALAVAEYLNGMRYAEYREAS